MKKGQKLTLQDAQEIRRRNALGESCYALGKEYGVSRMAISKIVRRLMHKEPIYKATGSSVFSSVDTFDAID